MNGSDKSAAIPPCAAAIKVDNIEISVGLMILYVRVAEHAPLRTTAQIARCIQDAYPRIVHHSCINAKGPTFAAVIEDTWMAHLLEHLIIDQQAAIAEEAHPCDNSLLNAVYAGTTERVGKREFVVTVGFKDDLVAAEALSNAMKIIDGVIDAIAIGHAGCDVTE